MSRARGRTPNILVLLSDTHSACATGCYGSPVARTPNLDWLAGEGVVFEAAYCQNPLCVPSRQSLVTGRRSFQTGVIHNDMPMPPLRTIAHVLKERGYDTAALGKMHFIPDAECSLGQERHHGFDRRVDYEEFWEYLRKERGAPPLPGLPDDPWRLIHLEKKQHHLQAPLVRPDPVFRNTNHPHGTLDFEGHQEALVLREWRRYLAEDRTRPFLAFVSFQSPHPTFLPTPEILAQYDGVEFPLPLPPDENALRHPFLGAKAGGAKNEVRRACLRYYHAFVSFTDSCVGEALRALEESGHAQGTLVVYASDHGDMLFEHGLSGKTVMYENSVRVPLIARWPGRIEGGWRYGGLVELLDLFPTLCEAAGAPIPPDVEGRSLLPDLAAKRDGGKEAVFSESYPMQRNRWRMGVWPHRMVRTREWKYVQYGPERADLFHLIDDPGERQNVVADPRFAADSARLRRMLEETLGPLPRPEERLVSGRYERLLEAQR
ncbi:MAG: sulfatase-like hydrolase/transferase [Candidatus Sumerlaeota bacterium]|nr:sulfatase-like hydrolase/transferase [Candidatus Sumerlaeota bacterium]